jgi:hypothetical protein
VPTLPLRKLQPAQREQCNAYPSAGVVIASAHLRDGNPEAQANIDI